MGIPAESLEETRVRARAPALWATAVGSEGVWYTAVSGYRRSGGDEAAAPDDPVHIGSNAKAMTATLAASLVEDGVLEWQTRVLDVLPELADICHPGYRDVTLEMLLRHTAAMPPLEEEEEFEGLDFGDGSPPEQRMRLAAYLLAREPEWQPGSEVRYSNAGYGLAGAVIEAAGGSVWEDMLVDRLLHPLGIRGGVGWPAAEDPGAPWGHLLSEERIVPHPPDDEYQLPAVIAPAGDVHVAFSGYGRFLQMHLRAFRGVDDLLPAAAVRYLHRPTEQGPALGWGVQQLGELGEVSGHAGSAGTFVIVAFVHHQRDVAAAVAANAGHDEAERACATLLRRIAGIQWESVFGTSGWDQTRR